MAGVVGASFDRDEVERQSAMYVGELVQSSIVGFNALRSKIREYMKNRVTVLHKSGMRVIICDSTYRFLTFTPCSKEWIRATYPPLNEDMIVFGVAELWKPDSQSPSRQIVFMITERWDVLAFNGGVMFYVAPGMRQFWCSPVYLEYENAIFPSTMRSHVKQKAQDMDELIVTYHVFDLQKSIMDANRSRCGFVKDETSRYVNKVYSALREGERVIGKNGLPPVFVDKLSLMMNCTGSFYTSFMSKWIEYNNEPVSEFMVTGEECVSYVRPGAFTEMKSTFGHHYLTCDEYPKLMSGATPFSYSSMFRCSSSGAPMSYGHSRSIAGGSSEGEILPSTAVADEGRLIAVGFSDPPAVLEVMSLTSGVPESSMERLCIRCVSCVSMCIVLDNYVAFNGYPKRFVGRPD